MNASRRAHNALRDDRALDGDAARAGRVARRLTERQVALREQPPTVEPTDTD